MDLVPTESFKTKIQNFANYYFLLTQKPKPLVNSLYKWLNAINRTSLSICSL